METVEDSLKHLFQQEFSKMVAVITKLFGLPYIEAAEDIVSETFLQATESWDQKGLPPNPAAWLYAVAKQKTLYQLRRNKIYNNKVAPHLRVVGEEKQEIADVEFSLQRIKDSQLQMMFAVCNPAIASEAQVGLALRILCGFSIDEIAEAFLSNKETVNKRLFRAKERLRSEKIKMEMPVEDEISARLNNVLHIIYLLFNEGYYSKTQNQVLRKELCLEAMRLGVMLTEYEKTNLPKTNALMALMCFHASRFEARLRSSLSTKHGLQKELVLYEQQDELLWDKDLINRGLHFLNLSAGGPELSTYHLEAKIAFWHCIKADTAEKWEDILGLYDKLMKIRYSPIVALNRIYALYKVHGVQTALPEAEKLSLVNNHFYWMLLAELYKDTDREKAKHFFRKASLLSRTEAEKRNIQEKIHQIT